MEDLVTFWKNKKVFITGHTGFKGAWLTLWLSELQAEVVGYALNPPTDINLFDLSQAKSKLKDDIRNDVRDFDALNEAIKTHQPDIIFHMAAQPLVRYSYLNPTETYATNVMGTVNLLEAVRQNNCVKTVVNVTTDKCYQNKEWHWGYREDEPMGGFDPYSSSKGCAELVTSAYRNSYFNSTNKIGLASARAGNVIGGGDWALDRLIPDLIAACIKNETVQIRYPHAIRPWQHVLEPLSGYLHLAKALHEQPLVFSEGWNFGPDSHDAKPVGWIANEIIKLWGGTNQWQRTSQEEVHEATYLKLDCSKAHAKLNWYPKWDIKKALAVTVEWYRAYQQNENIQQVTLQQIHAYMNSSR